MPRLTRMIIVTNLKTTIPCIIVGGALGALVGGGSIVRKMEFELELFWEA